MIFILLYGVLFGGGIATNFGNTNIENFKIGYVNSLSKLYGRKYNVINNAEFPIKVRVYSEIFEPSLSVKFEKEILTIPQNSSQQTDIFFYLPYNENFINQNYKVNVIVETIEYGFSVIGLSLKSSFFFKTNIPDFLISPQEEKIKLDKKKNCIITIKNFLKINRTFLIDLISKEKIFIKLLSDYEQIPKSAVKYKKLVKIKPESSEQIFITINFSKIKDFESKKYLLLLQISPDDSLDKISYCVFYFSK